MAILLVLIAGAALLWESPHPAGTITDIDGNLYKTVQIGTQIWMAENLRAKRYANGDTILEIVGNKEWGNAQAGARCFYNNQKENEIRYGLFYNWYAASDSRGICPQGWRIPSDEDWTTLSTYLGSKITAGKKLKSTVNFGTNSTNSTGFSALPTGYRMYTGKYLFQGNYAGFWSTTSGNEEFAWIRILSKHNDKIERMFFGKKNGIACRCMKDADE